MRRWLEINLKREVRLEEQARKNKMFERWKKFVGPQRLLKVVDESDSEKQAKDEGNKRCSKLSLTNSSGGEMRME